MIFKASILHPERYAGLIMFAPAIRDLRESIWLKKKVTAVLNCFCPRMKCHTVERSATKYNQIERIRSDPHNYLDGVLVGSAMNILNSELYV